MTRHHQRRLVCAWLGLLPLAAHSAAAANWPTQPIRWIVPYMPGTAPDTAARILAEAMGRRLGQAVIVENRGGAGGNIGAAAVARAAADGYTWVYSAGPMAANMALYHQPGYDILRDFTHVTQFSEADILLVMRPDLPYGDVAELVAFARANPGKLNYASGGVGTPSHLGMELFMAKAGIEMTHVPYKGAGETINALLGKQVEVAMPIFSVAEPLVRDGRLRALAVANTQRNATLPDVPTLAEVGVADVVLTSWGGLSVPKGTPEAIVTRLRTVAHEALADPVVIQALAPGGSRTVTTSGPAFEALIEKEMAVTRQMMAQLDIPAN